MSDARLTTLSALLWDLRAQCEQKLRALTDAQRLVDEDGGSGATVKRLLAHLDEILRLDSLARDTAQECRDVASTLEAEQAK